MERGTEGVAVKKIKYAVTEDEIRVRDAEMPISVLPEDKLLRRHALIKMVEAKFLTEEEAIKIDGEFLMQRVRRRKP